MRESVLGSRRWEMLSVARALRRNERKEMKASSGAWTLQTLLAMASTGSLDRSRPNTIVKWVAFHWKGNLCNATADLGFPCSPHPRASLQRPGAWKVLYPTLQSHQQGTGEWGGGLYTLQKENRLVSSLILTHRIPRIPISDITQAPFSSLSYM